ncbi:MAG: penicillin-binding protein [Solirubrobacteraceae bacterium]|nr:penicillin-binding protein [Solirubrobacteraceae bacterium]
MPRRRRSVFASRPSYGRSAMWLEPGTRRRRGRGPRRFLAPLVAVLALAAAGAAVAYIVLGPRQGDARRSVAQKFAAAWAKGDRAAMWALADADTRKAYPLKRFSATYRAAERAATVAAVRTGPVRTARGDRLVVPVSVRTRNFGTLRGDVVLPVLTVGKGAAVRWRPFLRLPGLRPGESVTRRILTRPRRAAILAADGRRLDRIPAAAAIVGRPPSAENPGSGLQRRFDARLGGRAGAELRFGRRLIKRVKVRRGRAVHATISPGMQRAAQQALGNRLGGVAVLRPRDGSVLALAGLAVSGPQPPGSTFKIVTVSAALQNGIAKPTSTYPVQTAARLSGVLLRNASNESCGGSLVNAFIVSCNSVFAPLGAKLGARRLVAAAERFGFNETPRIPSAKVSRISQASALKDSLAVGAAAIGQDRDLATPLQMASVGAAIAERGVRAKPRIVRSDPVIRHRAAPAQVARQVRTMMIGVVRGGTGTAAAIPGVQVAGKTGTAELRPTAGGPPDPKNTDAWFVAFAPASNPRVVVGVMLVGAGAGGAAAAPIARRVLQSALGR